MTDPLAFARARGEGPALTVGAPVIPDRRVLAAYLDRALDTGRLSNFGPLACRLEERLAERLDVPYVLSCASGTTALMIALRVFGVSGPAVVPSFTFAATAGALDWAGASARFCDVEPECLTLCPIASEAALADGARALVPVHTYGGACDVAALRNLAARYRKPLIYDAAHAFGARFRGKAVAAYGDAAALSLHATKPFHTVEGGALLVHDQGAFKEARRLANFGLDTGRGGTARRPLGLNGKMSEIHAAFGLALLDEYDAIRERRRAVMARYRARLPVDWLLPAAARGTGSDAYVAIAVPDGVARDDVVKSARREGVGLRAYFAPPLHEIDPDADQAAFPVSRGAAGRVICLPIHPDFTTAQIDRVADVVLRACDAPRTT